jgi:hypothetical protein
MFTVRLGDIRPPVIDEITVAPALGNDGGGGGGGGVVVVVVGGGGGGGGLLGGGLFGGGGGGGLFGAVTVNDAMPAAPAVDAVDARTVTSSLPLVQNVEPVHGNDRSADVPADWADTEPPLNEPDPVTV